jgi:hypothetical protein
MRKISLDVDALKVESFETAERGMEERGTVRAHYDRSYPNWGCQVTWNGYGCESVSGENACICSTAGENTCDVCM